MQIVSVRKVMRDYWLYYIALAIIYVGAIVFPISLFVDFVRKMFVQPLSLIEAATAVVLFIRSRMDSRCHRGFRAAYRQKIADQRASTIPWIKQLFDSNWGFFAPRYGSLAYRLVAFISFAETASCMFLVHKRVGDLILLTLATSFAATGIEILYLGLTTNSDEAA